MIELPLYFDYASTTPVKACVLEKMLPYFSEKFGNPESRTHAFGRTSKNAVNYARKLIARQFGAEEGEILFTSGATESINHALKGIYERFSAYGKHIISAKTEHRATLDTLEYLEKLGAEITLLSPDRDGLISSEQLEKAIRKDTILISVMWVNNETGVIQNIPEFAQMAFEKNILFFTDATQALGKINIDLTKVPIAGMAFSGHKIQGPKGIGGLYLSRKNPRIALTSLIHGGKQEFGLRAGTLNVPGIIGLSEAVSEIKSGSSDILQTLSATTTKYFLDKGASIVGSQTRKVPHILNVMAPEGIIAADLFKLNPNIAFSLGSACSSGSTKPSHVLTNMGLSEEEAQRCFRLSFGENTTEEEVKYLTNHFKFKN